MSWVGQGLRIAVIAVGIVLVAALLGLQFQQAWLSRVAIMGLLLVGGLLLEPTASLVPGIFGIVGDLMVLGSTGVGSGLGVDSLTLLIWATYLGIPYIFSSYREGPLRFGDVPWGRGSRSDEKGESGPDPDGEAWTSAPTEEGDDRTVRGGEITSRLRELLVNHFQRGRRRFGFDNLLYYHVQDHTAHLGYLINEVGEIDSDHRFTREIGQSVGWVLRHDEQLIQPARQIDWRNLQYHRRPVDLRRVRMSPLNDGDRQIGVLVAEWAGEGEDIEQDAYEDFVSETESFVRVDRSMRELKRSQDRLQLLEEMQRIEPSQEVGPRGVMHRCVELVSRYIPADDTEFYPPGSNDSNNVVQQRGVLYEQCFEWLEQGDHDTLRLDDVDRDTLGNKPVARFAPPDVTSLLLGRVRTGGDEAGMICLVHGEPGYFTSEDERILRLLLSHIGQVIRIGQQLEEIRDVEKRRQSTLQWLDEAPAEASFSRQSEWLVSTLEERLPVLGAGVYWRRDEAYQLVSQSGIAPPSPRLPRDHPLVRRVAESGSTNPVRIQESDRLPDWEFPDNCDEVWVIARGDREEGVSGFTTFFVEKSPEVKEPFNDYLGGVVRYLMDRLYLLNRQDRLRRRIDRDSMTGLLDFEPWKRELSRSLAQSDATEVVVWSLEVPGFEQLGRHGERSRVQAWLERLGAFLRDQMPDSTITRSYGSRFQGFVVGPDNEVSDRLERMRRTLMDWSFPSGRWPAEPRVGESKHSTPFPDVSTLLKELRYSSSGEE